ncbi:MAG TPA: GNAT family N-acetyltransferase [Actinomycetes bacterium]|jgi:RimJ/RimL family protein N-acetyltransferase|nr:GNAT family N-acetyltransferase [Actinomycetes bacterium]
MSGVPVRDPPDRAAEVILRDGSTVRVRPVRADDAAAVGCLFQGLSETSKWLRLFSACFDLDRVVGWATEVDHNRRDGLVAIAGDNGKVIAHAGFQRDDRRPDRAEFAIVIADGYQGRGLGTILLGRLAEMADRAGVRTFIGEVLADNHRMLRMLCHSGFGVSFRRTRGVVLVELPTSLGRGAGTITAA